jgi:hypothetical protein
MPRELTKCPMLVSFYPMGTRGTGYFLPKEDLWRSKRGASWRGGKRARLKRGRV